MHGNPASGSADSTLLQAARSLNHSPDQYWASEKNSGGHVGFVLSDRQEGVPLEKMEVDFGPYVFGKTIHVLVKLNAEEGWKELFSTDQVTKNRLIIDNIAERVNSVAIASDLPFTLREVHFFEDAGVVPEIVARSVEDDVLFKMGSFRRPLQQSLLKSFLLVVV